MTNIILAAIMFCMIVFLCVISFLFGFLAAVKLKTPNIILAAIMFCMIVFLCVISFLFGFLAAVKLKTPAKAEAEPLTEQQKTDIERKRKEYMNFLSYNGKEQ